MGSPLTRRRGRLPAASPPGRQRQPRWLRTARRELNPASQRLCGCPCAHGCLLSGAPTSTSRRLHPQSLIFFIFSLAAEARRRGGAGWGGGGIAADRGQPAAAQGRGEGVFVDEHAQEPAGAAVNLGERVPSDLHAFVRSSRGRSPSALRVLKMVCAPCTEQDQALYLP